LASLLATKQKQAQALCLAPFEIHSVWPKIAGHLFVGAGGSGSFGRPVSGSLLCSVELLFRQKRGSFIQFSLVIIECFSMGVIWQELHKIPYEKVKKADKGVLKYATIYVETQFTYFVAYF